MLCRALLTLLADLGVFQGEVGTDRAEGFAEIIDVTLNAFGGLPCQSPLKSLCTALCTAETKRDLQLYASP